MKKLIASVFVFVCMVPFCFLNDSSASSPETPVREVNIKGRYSMMLPSYLTEGYDLNDEASLQYQNIYKEVYVIVIDEDKTVFKEVFLELDDYDTTKTILENYARAQMESIRGNMTKVTKETAVRKVQTQSGEAMCYDVSGYQEDIDDPMGFKVAFLEGRYNLYMIMTWTFDKTFALYEDDMAKMVESFKELSGAVDGPDPKNDMAITRPEYMNPVEQTPGAAQEFYHHERQLQIAIFTESISAWDSAYATEKNRNMSLLEFFASEQKELLKKKVFSPREVSDLTTTRVNGLDAQTFTMYAKPAAGEKEMYYKVRFISGKKHLYILQTWTPSKMKDSNEQAMHDMLGSFTEFE